MKRVVISGYYGSKNAGDEAMLAAMIEVLSDLEPKLNITVISASPEDTKKRHGVEAISWIDIGSIISALRKSDLLISGGGSLLQNVTSGRSLYYYLSVILLARMIGTPVMLYAQGIGPVYGAFARWLMKTVSSRVSLITVRDHGSLEELENLAVKKPPIEVTADPVLAIHPVATGLGRAILKRYNADGAKPVVGISVREWRGWAGYKEAIAEAADRMAEEFGARIVFLPMQYSEDVRAAKRIAEHMKSPAILLDGEYTTSELLSVVGSCDLLISVRLHALIFAGVMDVPMVGISYDPKIDRFLDSVGQRPAADLRTVTADNLMEDVREKWKLRGVLREKNAPLLSELRRRAFRNAELALELIRKKRK